MRDIAAACLERLSVLGDYRYNLAKSLFTLSRDVTLGDNYAALAVHR